MSVIKYLTAAGIAVTVTACTLFPQQKTLDCTVNAVSEQYDIRLLEEKGWAPQGAQEHLYWLILEKYKQGKRTLGSLGIPFEYTPELVVTSSPAIGQAARGKFAAQPDDPANMTPAEKTYKGSANVNCTEDNTAYSLTVPLSLTGGAQKGKTPVVQEIYRLEFRIVEGKPADFLGVK